MGNFCFSVFLTVHVYLKRYFHKNYDVKSLLLGAKKICSFPLKDKFRGFSGFSNFTGFSGLTGLVPNYAK